MVKRPAEAADRNNTVPRTFGNNMASGAKKSLAPAGFYSDLWRLSG